MTKKIAIVIPAFNEEASIQEIITQIHKVTDNITDYHFNYLIVNDGSMDHTRRVVEKIIAEDPVVKLVNLSRNFGKEAALSAGVHCAKKYDAVIMMDADGQHPPERIPDFISLWEKGSKLVVGRRTSTENKSLSRNIASRIFNTLMRTLTSGNQGEEGITDFRLLDKQIVEEFSKLEERNRITRGLIDWMGFQRSIIDFEAPSRLMGESTYSRSKLLKLALNAFTSHSTRPLKLVGFIGLIVCIVSILLGIGLAVYTQILGDPYGLNISGSFLLGLIMNFMLGIVLVCQGLVALYIENIYVESQNRPLYIIEDSSL